MTLERILAQRSTVTVACNMDAVETRQVSVGYSRRLLLFPAGLFSNPMVNPPIIGRNGKKKERKKKKEKKKKKKRKKDLKITSTSCSNVSSRLSPRDDFYHGQSRGMHVTNYPTYRRTE